jgi:hypothetical protein
MKIGEAQMVECLLSTCKDLSSNSTITKKKKKKKGKKIIYENRIKPVKIVLGRGEEEEG